MFDNFDNFFEDNCFGQAFQLRNNLFEKALEDNKISHEFPPFCDLDFISTAERCQNNPIDEIFKKGEKSEEDIDNVSSMAEFSFNTEELLKDLQDQVFKSDMFKSDTQQKEIFDFN